MKTAWRNFQGRFDHIEGVQELQGVEFDKQKEAIGHLKVRTKALEKKKFLTVRPRSRQQATWTSSQRKFRT